MADSKKDAATQEEAVEGDKGWNFQPDVPLQNAQIFTWPLQPVIALKTLASYWLALTGRVFIFAVALLCWLFAHPDINTMQHLEPGWIAQIYLRNLFLLVALASLMHIYFYTWSKQGMELKFDKRPMLRNARAFNFSDQVLDNMFWSLASGVTIWSAYEVAMMWAYANGFIPPLSAGQNPLWFAAVFVLIPIWYSFYFYWVHRFLHWPPLYKRAHAVHHRNINVGPWSGMSMHPVEHLLYLASPVIHFILPTHPLHIIFHLQFNVLIAVITHSGFEGLLVNNKKRVDLGYFFHQLHHRYFECNYGTDEMPWDKWFGTFHDGTAAGTDRVRERRKRMHAK